MDFRGWPDPTSPLPRSRWSVLLPGSGTNVFVSQDCTAACRSGFQEGPRQIAVNPQPLKAKPPPATGDRTRKPAPTIKPKPSGLSREELRTIVVEIIG